MSISAESVNDIAQPPTEPAKRAQAAPEPELPAPARTKPEQSEPEPPAPARTEPERTEPESYKVQFTATEEYVKLVEQAKALLSRSDPRITLDELHLRAMRALVAALQQKKHAVTAKPRQPNRAAPSQRSEPEPPRQRGTQRSEAEPPRQRGRHVPAAVQRVVFARDEGRCTYVDAAGRRCHETHGLELHHRMPFARGGEHSEANISLRCRAHNALAAEQDFGRALIERAKDSSAHQPWAASARGG
jgi:5-methylcytosine-specific restriction endonuclease McrA